MAQYRHRPSIVEAQQYFESQAPSKRPPGVQVQFGEGRPFVVTIHDQRAYLHDGDWVVQEADKVHYYPVKPDIFEAHYELVTTDDPIREVGDQRVRRAAD